MIAKAIQDGIKSVDSDIECNLYDVNDFDLNALLPIMNESTAFCLGSPTLNKNAVPPITNLLMDIDSINSHDKHVLIFGSYGWSGEAQNVLMQTASALQLKPYEKGIHIRFAPSSEQLEQARTIAQAFVQTVMTKI
jgi:flavorubredoxin